MTRTLTALAAAGAIAVAAIAVPSTAEAGGGRIAAGVIGGLAAGAIIGGALAQPGYAYAPGYSSYGYYGGPPCQIRRERVWDGFAWRIRRVQVCY